MKKTITIMLAVLLGGIAAQAQEAGYQPLVREGVVWHYSRVYEDMPNEDYCTMFFEGDSIINNVVYKKCIEVSANGSRRVAALMREQDKIVYSIGGSTMAEMREGLYDGEIILYDFQDPSNMFPSSNLDDFVLMHTTVKVDGVSCDGYAYDNFNKMIESVGLDGSGTLTEHVFAVLSSTHYQYTGLAYVEKDGKVIYRGCAYDETSSYQPLVREGVVWHYADVNEVCPNDDNCTMFFDGDSIINNVVYKKCIQVSANGRRRVAALMREQDRIVYSIGGSTHAEEREGVYDGEIILYDFANPANMFPDEAGGLNLTQSTVMIDGVPCQSYTSYWNTIVEGIGLDGSGTLTDLDFNIATSTHHQYIAITYVEKDGKAIYRGRAYETGYRPMVRVGVRWKCAETRYRYDEPRVSTSYYWYEFKGDTTINGKNYLKLFRTTEDSRTEIPCDSQSPLAYMRNEGHWVMVSGAKAYGGNPETLDNVFDVLRQEGDEYALYYFDNPSEAYNTDYTFMPTDSVLVGDCPFAQVAWTLGGDDKLCAGIGWDLCEGDPFVLMVPIATSPHHNEYGFVGLYDLDGNVLYKGACYDDSLDGLARVEVRVERLSVRQSATTVLVDVPSDGLLRVFDMTGHVMTCRAVAQGTTEIPAGQFSAGVYIVQLTTATGALTAKVVVK